MKLFFAVLGIGAGLALSSCVEQTVHDPESDMLIHADREIREMN